MDNVVLITDKGAEMQKMLDITYNLTKPFQSEFGQRNSQEPTMGNIENILLALGDVIIN